MSAESTPACPRVRANASASATITGHATVPTMPPLPKKVSASRYQRNARLRNGAALGAGIAVSPGVSAGSSRTARNRHIAATARKPKTHSPPRTRMATSSGRPVSSQPMSMVRRKAASARMVKMRLITRVCMLLG
ncbi:MAG: hypothetical protein BWY76_03312 [bacterium ADurb.Bin429]|nr:MAG: hypothetical protein BWY76_03312 [bacterium ADurb.Bin429]